jgi:hypothetical protein
MHRVRLSEGIKAIAFELLWQAKVSGGRKDSIEASFVTGHDFSRAAKRSEKRSWALALATFRAAYGLFFRPFPCFAGSFLPNPNASSFKCDCLGEGIEIEAFSKTAGDVTQLKEML